MSRPHKTLKTDLPVIPILVLASLIFSLSLVPRFYDIVKWLPQYSIDENDIVEPSIAFLGGDINPRVHGYGPLYAYLLTSMNYLWMKFEGLGYVQYSSDIFFEPTRFYLMARASNSILNIVLSIIGFWITRVFLGTKTAIVALPLLAFPFADILTHFTVRTDTLLAVFANLTILSAYRISNSGKTIWYVLSGIFIGLAVATKPLPGLLAIPAVLLAHVFHLDNQGSLFSSNSRKYLIRRTYSWLINAASSARIYYFFLAAFITNFITNPYSIFDIITYLRDQADRILHEGSREFEYGYAISRFFDSLGYAFVIFSVIAIVYITVLCVRQQNQKFALFLAYPSVYFLAFAFGSARDYWYVPLIPVLCAGIAKLITDISSSSRTFHKNIILIFLPLAIIAQPFLALTRESHAKNTYTPFEEYHTSLAGKSWVEENILQGTSIILHGWLTDLPRIVDIRPDEQAKIGQYFMYRRKENKPFRDLFSKVHNDYIANGNPAYYLTYTGPRCGDQNTISELSNRLSSNAHDYLITSCSLQETVLPSHKAIKFFGPPIHPYGHPFWIYKLK